MERLVLVIDSSAVSRLILAAWLRRAGYYPLAGSDPVALLCALTQQNSRPAAMFIGVDPLEAAGSYWLLRLLRASPRFQACPRVALLRQRAGLLTSLRARLAGATHVLRKPLIRHEVLDLLFSVTGGTPALPVVPVYSMTIPCSLDDYMLAMSMPCDLYRAAASTARAETLAARAAGRQRSGKGRIV
jgi:CheY-like chemotaxis protein